VKSVLRLLFVITVALITLGMPTDVRAGGTQYTCNSSFGPCYNNLMAWMNSCTYGCSYGQQPTNSWCYSVETVTFEQVGDAYVLTDTDRTNCFPGPQGGQTCLQGCVNEFNYELQQCLQMNCTVT
jgi:hypothetical protein